MTEDLGLSLLLVDDDDVFRTQMGRALRRRGYVVTEAANATDALAAARAETPEYALVDLRLGAENGLELVKQLRELDATTVVVMLTGYGSIATAVEAIKLGANHYLSKPADADDVVNALERARLPAGGAPLPSVVGETPSLARAEWEHINRVLMDHAGNISQTARALGMHRRSLQRKLGKKPVPR